jgi:hypothetical protein
MDTFKTLSESIILEKNNDVNNLHEFIEKRKTGADKIRKAAEAKGGPAKLTAVHFAAKERPYKEALSLSTKENCSQTLKKKAQVLVSKLKSWHTMSQREFQDVMGQLEAYGEIYIKTVKPNSMN